MLLAGRYYLEQRIGRGGMGEVWRGTDQMLGRTVAIKIMLPALRDEPGFTDRFRTEARIMAQLKHPGVVNVYELYSDAQVAFLVMEYVDGDPLSRTLGRIGRLTAARTMALIAQAADALEAAHQAGIVHRDVKPGNLMVRANGTLVITDFGISRSAFATQLTGTGTVLGTVGYLSPEQLTGQLASPASDVYALGVVAYHCLAGRRPFEGESLLEIAMKHVRDPSPPLPSDIPPAVREIVMRTLAKDPGNRWPSAASLAAVARQAAAALGRIATAPAGSTAQPQTPANSEPRGVGDRERDGTRTTVPVSRAAVRRFSSQDNIQHSTSDSAVRDMPPPPIKYTTIDPVESGVGGIGGCRAHTKLAWLDDATQDGSILGTVDFEMFEISTYPSQDRNARMVLLRGSQGEVRLPLHLPTTLDEQVARAAVAMDIVRLGILSNNAEGRHAMEVLGSSMFGALLPADGGLLFDACRTAARSRERILRIVLRLRSAELEELPWELMFDPGAGVYLALEHSIVRYLEMVRPISDLPVPPPLYILGMIATPVDCDPLSADAEKAAVQDAVERLQRDDIIRLSWVNGQTWQDLQRKLYKRQYHAVHFIGHGGFDEERQEGYLALADSSGRADRVPASELGATLSGQHLLRLAVLNTCESGRGDGRRGNASTAQALARRGVSAVVSMRSPISDLAARRFAGAFYEALTTAPIDVAVTIARLAVKHGTGSSPEWATPITFLRSTNANLIARQTED
jgi:serine/threonine protein kinase